MATPSEMLRGAGLRSTGPRRAVLEELLRAPHATAPDLADAIRRRLEPAGDGVAAEPALSHQGLYNVLDDLTAAGLIRCIKPAGSSARYELRVGDNHHHLVCRSCGRVADVDCAVGAAPCLEPSDSAGFTMVDGAEVTWWGVCDSCSATLAEPPIPSVP
jgi:Fur family ferric uptake transcriptional regulator